MSTKGSFLLPFRIIIIMLSYLTYVLAYANKYSENNRSDYFSTRITSLSDNWECGEGDVASEGSSELRQVSCAIVDIFIFPVIEISEHREVSNYCLKEDYTGDRFSLMENPVIWKLVFSCCLSTGIGLRMLFLFCTATRAIVRTILKTVAIVVAILVAGLWYLYFQSHPPYDKVLLILAIFCSMWPVVSALTTLAGHGYVALMCCFREIFIDAISISFLRQEKIDPVIALLKKSTQALFSMPQLFLIPIVAFFGQLMTLIAFFTFTMYIGSKEKLTVLSEKYSFQRPNMAIHVSTILNACLVVWILQFTFGIQCMIFTRTIARRYFSKIKDFLYSHTRNGEVISDCYLGSTTLEAVIIAVLPTVSSLLETMKRNFLICYLSIVEGFVNTMYKKLYFFSGTGAVILTNLRIAVTIMAWNLFIGLCTALTTTAAAIWCSEFTPYGNQDLLVSTIFFLILLVMVYFMVFVLHKKQSLVIVALKESIKVTLSMPSKVKRLTYIHVIELVVLVAFATWTMNARSYGILGGFKQIYLTYQRDVAVYFSMVFNACLMIWVVKLIGGAQYMILSGTVAKWYFSKDKASSSSLISTGTRSRFKIYLGDLAFDSLLTIVDRNRNVMFFPLIGRCLRYLFKKNYISTGKMMSWSKPGVRDAEKIHQEIMDMSSLNYTGYFVIFLAQVLVLVMSLFFTYLIMLDTRLPCQLNAYVIVGILSIAVTVSCLSAIQTVLDTIFLCLCGDWLINDVLARPFSKSKDLKEFMLQSQGEFAERED